jgi:hypothetical protein
MFFRLCLLYTGHSQYFVLGTLFEQMFALSWLLSDRPPDWIRNGMRYLVWNVPVALLGAPFLIPLGVEVGRSLLRRSPLSYAEYSGLTMPPLAWLAGQLLVFMPTPQSEFRFWRAMPFLSHIGYVPALVWPGVLALWKQDRSRRNIIIAAMFCFMVALLWSWNVLGSLIYLLPIFNRFRFPFKLVFFAGFFECLLAVLVVARWKVRWQSAAVAVFLANWLWVFLVLPNHAWRIQDNKPPFAPAWLSTLRDGRYFTVAGNPLDYSPNKRVELNYSILWGLDNLLGYEPMHSTLGGQIALGNIHTGVYEQPTSDLPIEHLRRWSVRYVVVGPDRSSAGERLKNSGFELRAVDGQWTLWEDPQVQPHVRWSDAQNSAHGIRWTRRVNSIDITLDPRPAGTLELAFAANPGLELCLDQSCKPISVSQDGLVREQVPAGVRYVRLVYRNDLFIPSLAIALLTLAVLTWLLPRVHK